jgi:single-stranded-DNA-specific exonuclease
MPKLWKLKQEIPKEISQKLAAYPKLLAQLLFERGLTEEKEIKEFLEPEYKGLNSPFLFKDMQKAVDRIWQAIENKEKICIYGDYDADAVTANAVLQQAFRYLGVEVESYIPDRFTEGYGVNMEALQKIKDGGSSIIITVDCGTNSVDAADFCRDNNIDLIITDHHEVIGELPKAYSIINPKNREDSYPYENITGVGVAFKLACGMLSQKEKVKNNLSFRASASEPRNPLNNGKGIPPLPQVHSVGRDDTSDIPQYIEGYEKWLLDLVAIGTVADCHSLKGENRILVKYGLKVLAKTKWAGLRALMTLAGVDYQKKALDAYVLGFVIAPRLNAAGRLEHADTALHLLMEKEPLEALEKAGELEEINSRRQKLTQAILSEAKEKVILIQERKVLALVGEGWPKGVMGLVAGKLAEEYYKPVIVLERTENICTGSARTAGEFDIIEALKFSSQHLVKFGGHKQAAGLTLQAENFELFYQKLLDYADANTTGERAERVLELDAELSAEDLDPATCSLLATLEPFGVDNPKPKFLVREMQIQSARNVGAAGQHTQYGLIKGNKKVSAIAFHSSFLEKNFKVGDTIDAACELMEDKYNGNNGVKLKIIDFRATNH